MFSKNTEEREDVVPVLKEFRIQAILRSSEWKGATHQKESEA